MPWFAYQMLSLVQVQSWNKMVVEQLESLIALPTAGEEEKDMILHCFGAWAKYGCLNEISPDGCRSLLNATMSRIGSLLLAPTPTVLHDWF